MAKIVLCHYCCSHYIVSDSVTPWTATQQSLLSFTMSWSLLKVRSIKSVMPSNHLILCRPLLLTPTVFPSIRVFSSETGLPIRRPKDWSFSFSIGPSGEYAGSIFFRMHWLDILAVQGTLKSFLMLQASTKVSKGQCTQQLWRHLRCFLCNAKHLFRVKYSMRQGSDLKRPAVTRGRNTKAWFTHTTFVGMCVVNLFNS